MKSRNVQITLALGLSIAYTALLAAGIHLRAIDAGAPESAAVDPQATLSALSEQPSPSVQGASLRLRMTLPFVRANPARPGAPTET